MTRVSFGNNTVKSYQKPQSQANISDDKTFHTILYMLQKPISLILHESFYGKLVSKNSTRPQNNVKDISFDIEKNMRQLLAQNGIKNTNEQDQVITTIYQSAKLTIADLLQQPFTASMGKVIIFLLKIVYPSFKYTCKLSPSMGHSGYDTFYDNLLKLLKSDEVVYRFNTFLKIAHGNSCGFIVEPNRGGKKKNVRKNKKK